MKTLEEFKALSDAQITNLGYDKIRDYQDRIREILNEKVVEINARAKSVLSEIIGSACPDFEVSVTPSAYRMVIIRIPGTRYEINIDVDMNGYGDIPNPNPEITVSTFPNINTFSITNPDKNREMLIKMYYSIIFKKDIYSGVLDFIMSIKDGLNEVKDEFRRYKKAADTIRNTEDKCRKEAEWVQTQKNCLETICHDKPAYVRVIISNNANRCFIYRGEPCDISPDSNGKFTSDYKRKKDDPDYYDAKIRWIPADRLKDKEGRYILNNPALYK